MSAWAPPPASTTTSTPLAFSRRTTSGTRATRRSPGAVSLGTPTVMVARQPIRWGARGASRCAAAAWTRSSPPHRQRTPGQGRERLRGHPDRRLAARARVADRAGGRLQGAQVGDGRPRPAAVQPARTAAGGEQALDGEGRRLGVRAGAAALPQAAVGVLPGREEARGAGDRTAGPRAPGRDERLQDGAGDVDVGGPA